MNMKKNSKVILSIAVAVVVVAAILVIVFKSVGWNLDVVGTQSIASLDAVLKTIPDSVKPDEMNGGWSLSAPDNTVRFIWSKDCSRSPVDDVMLETDIKPFVDAGLDATKLPDNYASYDGMLMVGKKLGNDALTYDDATPLKSYEQIVNRYRDSISYHTSLDHYGVKLRDGNMFEWARDMLKNTATGADQDKDIVFVMNPDPLIAAGVDPSKVQGWVYTQVPIEENGKTTRGYRFLKPFNLK